MRKSIYIACILLFISCEEVVVVDLPPAQNLFVVEGWLTSVDERQYIRLTRSNGFSDQTQVIPISDADVVIQTRSGATFLFSYDSDGYYYSEDDFAGIPNTEYRLRIQLSDDNEIRSDWEEMPVVVPINNLTVESFLENDPDNPNQQFTVFFPKVDARDPSEVDNFYRWVFFRNGELYTEPESITIQDDRFFDGNLIPNNFEAFAYESGDEMIVQFQSISQNAYAFLELLKSQTTTLGTSTGTTPAIVNGNLKFASTENTDLVLGYFGTIAVSSDTTIVE